MVKKICHDSCECHKCKTKTKKSKSKPKRKEIRQVMPNVIMDMRAVTMQPNNNIPSQFNTPKDILDIKNSLIELLQKEKKKLSGVISTQTDDLKEIVDDIATEKAIDGIGIRNKNYTKEYQPKSPKQEAVSNNGFETSSNKFFATAQGHFKRSGNKNEIDKPYVDPINGLWVASHKETFEPETSQVFKELETIRHNNSPNYPYNFQNSSNPIATGNSFYETTVRPAPIFIKQEHTEVRAEAPKTNFQQISNPIQSGSSFQEPLFFPEQITRTQAPITNKANKPNIFTYEEDEDYGRPKEGAMDLTPIKKYGKSEKQIAKETIRLKFLPEHVEPVDFRHHNTRSDKEWITPEKK